MREAVLMVGLQWTIQEACVIGDQLEVAADCLAYGLEAVEIPVY